MPDGSDDLEGNGIPRYDDSGDVDLNLIELNLELTPAERIEKHYHARMFVQRLRRIAKERYGTVINDPEAID